MRRLLLSGLFIILALFSFAQVSTDPSPAIANQPVTITVDVSATSMSGYTGDVWIWAWIEKASGDIDAPTNVNPATSAQSAALMTRSATDGDIYTITFTPTDFFQQPATEFDQIGLLLKGQDWSNGQTPDYLFNVISGVFEVNFTSPSLTTFLANPGDAISIIADASEVASITLKVDGAIVKTATNVTQLTYTETAAASGIHYVNVSADNGTTVATDSFSYTIRTTTVTQARPAGVIDGINYNNADATTATLSLLAPLKSSVYVIGDFNNWEIRPEYLMKKDGEHFWLQLTGLVPGKEYIFQYLVDETIVVADPYTDKVSDPYDDKFIDDVTYPNLIKYPYGLTTNRASVLQTDQQPYNWSNTSFTPVPKENLVIYELLVRDFDSRHSYSAVLDRLDYLQSLGVNAIELMPVNEFEGNVSWGYNPNFYFAPDKYYGTKNDLKALIDECHNRGIAIIMDLVLNHSYGSSPMVRMYWDDINNRPAADNPWYNQVSNFENPDAQWGYDFNHESAYTQNFVDSVTSYWMGEYKVDGFRFDFTKGFSNNIKSISTDSWGSLYDADRIAILERMTDAIWNKNPDAYVIFEHLAENSEETVLANYGILLWGNMNYNYNQMTKGYASGVSIDWAYYVTRGWSKNSLDAYMESHDEERIMYRNLTEGNESGIFNVRTTSVALQRTRAAAAFFLTIPGPKMIWQFGEFGYDVSIEDGGRLSVKPTKWEYLDDEDHLRLFNTYKELIKLRKEYDVFTQGSFTWQPNGELKSIHIANADTSVVIVGNFGIGYNDIDPQFQHTGTWYDFFYNTEITVNNENDLINLAPGEFHIYTDKKLYNPNYVLSTRKAIDQPDIHIYPNPVNYTFSIYPLPETYSNDTWLIIDAMGRTVQRGNVKDVAEQGIIDVSNLPTGIYSLILGAGNNKNAIKFIKN